VNRHEVYRPLVERNLENYQTQYLARRYDFGKESRIAALIVAEVNRRMDEVDSCLGVKRARPFELCVCRRSQAVTLPLFRPEYLEPILAGDTFAEARRLVFNACAERLEQVLHQVEPEQVLAFIDPWALVRRKGPNRYIDNLQEEVLPLDERDTAAWRHELDRIRPQMPTARLGVLDLSAPQRVVKSLVQFVVTESGLGPVVARQLVEELITLRNICCPMTGQLRHGEMPFLATHVHASLSEEIATRFRRQAPVILTVWEPEELRRPPRSVPEYLAQLKRRIVRVCFEAYRQNGLLSLMDLQWIFQISSARISELIRSFQKEHNIVVPTPGTVLDAGRSMTHKDIIVNLHLQGYTVKEIARITYHSPRSVDNYIGTFQGVMILRLFGVPPRLMASLLRKSLGLIEEHLELIRKFYPNEDKLRQYLSKQGVKSLSIIS